MIFIGKKKVISSGTWVPSDDATLYTTFFADYDSEVGVTPTGSLVDQWDDQTPTGFDLTQTGSARPNTGTRTLVDGQNVLDFGGGQSMVSGTTGPLGSGNIAFFAIGLVKVDLAATARNFCFSYGGSSYVSLGFGDNAGGWELHMRFGNGAAITSYVPTAGEELLFSISHGAGATHADIELRINEVVVTHDGGANSVTFGSSDQLKVGVRQTGGDNFDGGVRLLSLLDAIPTTANREKIAASYLWANGLEGNLPSGHTYEFSAP